MVSIKPSAFSADVDIVGAIGMGIVSDQAFAAGVASVPGLWDDPQWDGWYVWRSFAFHYEFHDATSTGLASLEFEVDSKAMRKVTDNETCVVVVESEGSAALEAFVGVRTLFKLS